MKLHILLVGLTAILKAQAQTTTMGPGPTTTVGPVPTTTMGPGPTTTMGPGPTTTMGPGPTTMGPGPTTTMGPGPTTTMGPGPTTTMGPGPTTTMGPGPTTTMGPGPTTTMGPGPTTTMGPEPTTTMGASTTVGPCGAGWVENSGFCYWLMLPSDFEDGHRNECAFECELAGGTLASIHSEDEENFVLDLIQAGTDAKHDTWLGGRHSWEPEGWAWEDGTEWDFEIWHNHEPNGDDEDVEYCLYTQGHQHEGGWLDAECAPEHGHNGLNCLCKKSL